ncbi:hypothetical protein K7X08_036921 [Anisodus acutangulus]|uniref:Uncharacterized protein n=1 Tax=Anisodus acutangulus TaxID=402998 RepID=A0A9Q1L7Q5_9SOLA|nr:hypothetical protein K7X08_036921 [Anisodus acutangulus]
MEIFPYNQTHPKQDTQNHKEHTMDEMQKNKSQEDDWHTVTFPKKKQINRKFNPNRGPAKPTTRPPTDTSAANHPPPVSASGINVKIFEAGTGYDNY